MNIHEKPSLYIITPCPEDDRKPEGKWVTRVLHYVFGVIVAMLTFSSEDDAKAYVDSVTQK